MKNVAVITGAGSGIGLAIARIFKNDVVLICGRTQSKIDNALKVLKDDGVEAHGMACDVSDRSSVEALANKGKSLGNVRWLINNAAVVEGSTELIFKINMLGTIYPTEVFYPLMGEESVIINISSIAGYMYPMTDGVKRIVENASAPDFIEIALKEAPVEGITAYSLTKKFVHEYTKQCCVEFAKKRIRVVSISPGPFTTDMLETAKSKYSLDEGSMIKNSPAGREGNPVECAYLVEYLIDKKAEFINGTDIVIDGGSSLVSQLDNSSAK